MKRCIRAVVSFALAFGLLLVHPARAAAESVITICYYMGDVRDTYGGSGALWYCEVWNGNEFWGGWTEVVRYDS
ncbi:MAG TPA: hypothetical protein VF006_04955 [Longimicrobium sp.]